MLWDPCNCIIPTALNNSWQFLKSLPSSLMWRCGNLLSKILVGYWTGSWHLSGHQAPNLPPPTSLHQPTHHSPSWTSALSPSPPGCQWCRQWFRQWCRGVEREAWGVSIWILACVGCANPSHMLRLTLNQSSVGTTGRSTETEIKYLVYYSGQKST